MATKIKTRQERLRALANRPTRATARALAEEFEDALYGVEDVEEPNLEELDALSTVLQQLDEHGILSAPEGEGFQGALEALKKALEEVDVKLIERVSSVAIEFDDAVTEWEGAEGEDRAPAREQVVEAAESLAEVLDELEAK